VDYDACDDCEQATEVLVTWLNDHRIDALCTACLLRRLLPIMASVMEQQEQSAEASA
jgi:hypothetical protein